MDTARTTATGRAAQELQQLGPGQNVEDVGSDLRSTLGAELTARERARATAAMPALNTALAKGSIELGELQRESALLSEAAGNLQEEIDRASASGALAEKASRLGLVRSNERAHIDITTGKISGTAHPASRSLAFPVVTSPTPVARPKATPIAKPTAIPTESTPTPTTPTR